MRSIALAGGVALHAINVYIATTILPSVVADIGGLDYYAWNTTLFVVASIVGSALAARAMGWVGPRAVYMSAGLVFAAGTLLCATAPAMSSMLAGRVIQGFGGGLLFALSYALIRLVFAETLWPRAMALVSGMWGVATLIGPAVGGIFAQVGAWRFAFWSLLPATGVFMVLALLVVPKRGDSASLDTGVPLKQLALLSAAVLALSISSIRPALVWNFVGIVAALSLTVLFVVVERKADCRLLPRQALEPSAPLAALYLSLGLLAVAVTASEIFVPLFLQVLHDQTPLIAGYLAALMAGGWTVASIASAGATGRQVRRSIGVSPVLAGIGMVALAALVPLRTSGSWISLAPMGLALFVVGFGVGLAWPHLLTRVLQVAPAEEQALASSSITTVQLFATASGAALAGVVANLSGLGEANGSIGTSQAAFWLFAAFAAAPMMAIVTCARVARDMRHRGPDVASSGIVLDVKDRLL